MSEASISQQAAESAAGRHRGQAAPDDAEKAPPHGKHRRPADD